MKHQVIAILCLLFLSGLPDLAQAQTDAGKTSQKPPLGCWSRVTREAKDGRRCPTVIGYCFGKAGKLKGHSYDTCDGWDYMGRWRMIKNKLELKFSENKTHCNYSITEDPKTLILSDCDRAGTYNFISQAKPGDFY